MTVNRKRRRADGTLRPTIVRRRRRKNREKNREARQAWLANFKPGDRDRFFRQVDVEQAVYLAGFEKATGLPQAEAAALLERTATERRWRKLRTLDGTVVGIAPVKAAPVREADDGGCRCPGPDTCAGPPCSSIPIAKPT